MTIPMALFDYIPVLLFGAGAILLLRSLYGAMGFGKYAALSGGLVLVFLAGFTKATWKLLYAANICDFQIFNKLLLPMQAFGFMLTGVALVLHLCKKTPKALSVAAPAVYSGSLLFILMMVLGSGLMCGSLAVLAKKAKKPVVVALFILAFVLMMAMGYLAATADQTSGLMNWIEEGVNTCGQLCLFLGVRMLSRAGLADAKQAQTA